MISPQLITPHMFRFQPQQQDTDHQYRYLRIIAMRRAPTRAPLGDKQLVAGRIEADQKQVIVGKLKAEAQSLRKNQTQFSALKEQYAELDRKYRAQLEQKNLIDHEYKARHESALRHMGQLRNEVDAIKAELRDKKMEIQDLRTDEEQLKSTLDQRIIELQKLKNEVNANLCDSDELQNQRVALTLQQENLRKIISNLASEHEQLFGENSLYKQRLEEMEDYLDQLSAQTNILKEKIKDFEDTNNQLDAEAQQAQQQICEMENEIYDCQQECANLQAANATIGSNADLFRSQAMHNQKASQAQLMKNNGLTKKLAQAQHVLKIRTSQVQQGRQQLQHLQGGNQSMQQTNDQLAQDLQACRKHLEHLSLLNQQLVGCLENFSAEDRKVEELVSRDQRVRYMRDRVNEASSFDVYASKQTARTDVSFTSSRRRYNF